MIVHPELKEGMEKMKYDQRDFIKHKSGLVTVVWETKSLIEWQVFTIHPDGLIEDFAWPKLGSFSFNVGKEGAEELIRKVTKLC